jgi:3-oxoacyl-[acyl-carrier protein] reductase
MNKLTAKVAVVTGASKGIGASIAEHLAAEGASVVVNYANSKAGAEAIVRRIKEKGGKALAVQADVSKHEEIKRLFAETKAAYGKLLLATQEAVKLMGPEGGSIINMSSIAGRMPVQNASVYSASKAAVDAITVALAQELGPRKIRVNSLNPGMVETEGLHASGLAESDFRKMLEAETPLGRIAQPEDIARAAVFFATDDSGWVTGESLLVSGGKRG